MYFIFRLFKEKYFVKSTFNKNENKTVKCNRNKFIMCGAEGMNNVMTMMNITGKKKNYNIPF